MAFTARCPFCDSIAVAASRYYQKWYVKCAACLAIGPSAQGMDEALTKWNNALRKKL
jgi:hypothetical protein